jgi:hypothetical protein
MLDVLDRALLPRDDRPLPDLITGRRLTNLGGNMALQLCLELSGDDTVVSSSSGNALDDWAERFLIECGELAEAELVLSHCESGFMRLLESGDGALHAWIATRQTPATWRERADIDWWADSLAQRHEPALRALRSERPELASGTPGVAAYYRRLASLYLDRMAYQFDYPADAAIGGCTVATYRALLGWVIAAALQERDRGQAVAPRSERDLIAAMAAELAIDPSLAGRAVSAFTLDRTGAAYHAAVPGVAAAPLVRLAADRLVWSLHGLTSEPLFFLRRELRRRDAEEYHNAAHLREAVFRQDLYALFPDRRFLTSTGRIELRRETGQVRTDIDAAIFDRKTGSLGLFELKSHDPYARSTAELARQRDNVHFANRQLSGVLSWLQRHGADALLSRVDHRAARSFRVQKVYPFVLGRYLVHFNDGPRPDRRAAWGAWPQILRLLDSQPFAAAGGNPLASLFARLANDGPLAPPTVETAQQIVLGDTRLVVHPSYAALRTSQDAARG